MPANSKDNKAQEQTRWASMLKRPDRTISNKMQLVDLDISVLLDPEETFANIAASAEGKGYSAIEAYANQYQEKAFNSLVEATAKQTGADPEQIRDTHSRTEEQQRAMLEIAGKRELARIELFSISNYRQALSALEPIKSRIAGAENEEASNLKHIFLLYYFAIHPEIRPSHNGDFTQARKDEIVSLYDQFETFLIEYFKRAILPEEPQYNDILTAIQVFIEQENPADAQEIIEHLSSVLPDKYVIPNNKLANILTKEIIDVGRVTLEVQRRGAKKVIETTCLLTYEGDNLTLSGRQPFTEYDRNVYNAVSSLYVYGDKTHVVTPAMVYRAMTGLTDNEKPTAQQIAAVTRSLDKMRFIRARIDCTAELQARRITLNSQQINGGEIDTYLLTAEAIKIRAGGNVVHAYRIIKTPILYEYASAIKQVLTLPASMLDVKEIDRNGNITTRSLPNTETRILIKGYLLRRIEGMKGDNNLSNDVIALYDYQKDGENHKGLYSIAGKPNADKTEAKRIRDDIEKMLAFWKATGRIKDFGAQIQNKKITGYKIAV